MNIAIPLVNAGIYAILLEQAVSPISSHHSFLLFSIFMNAKAGMEVGLGLGLE